MGGSIPALTPSRTTPAHSCPRLLDSPFFHIGSPVSALDGGARAHNSGCCVCLHVPKHKQLNTQIHWATYSVSRTSLAYRAAGGSSCRGLGRGAALLSSGEWPQIPASQRAPPPAPCCWWAPCSWLPSPNLTWAAPSRSRLRVGSGVRLLDGAGLAREARGESALCCHSRSIMNSACALSRT